MRHTHYQSKNMYLQTDGPSFSPLPTISIFTAALSFKLHEEGEQMTGSEVYVYSVVYSYRHSVPKLPIPTPQLEYKAGLVRAVDPLV